MRRLPSFSAILVLLLSVCSGLAAQEADFYVAPGGDDDAIGTIEKPFATLARARDAVREVRTAGLKRDIQVLVRGGTYELREPVVFDLDDSGTTEHSITYAAYPGEKPVFSGGMRITGFSEAENGAWEADVPDGLFFRELFVGKERRHRARHPNEDYFRVEQVGPDKRTSFTYSEGDLKAYDRVRDIELHFLHDWSTSRIPLESIDPETRTVSTQFPVGGNARHYAMDWFEQHPRYLLENSPDFLDAPGEWYLDEDGDKLLYIPKQGEKRDGFTVVVPVAEKLLEVRGFADKPWHVENLIFEGLTFHHAAWATPERGYAAGQATFHERRTGGPDNILRSAIPPAVDFQVARNCAFIDGEISHVGTAAIAIGQQCHANLLENTLITDVAANGVLIGEDRARTFKGESWWRNHPEQAATDNVMRGNIVEHCGQLYPGAVGVWVGLARETKIVQNTIRYLPYTGISIGWMWNPTPTPARENVIANNHIHHVMQVLSDGGGIYSLGLQPGSELRGNIIHDVPLNLGRAESNGMFLDEGTTDIVVEDNLIYGIDKSPLRFHRATTNLVRNNTLLVKGDTAHIRYNNTDPADITQEDNRVLKEGDVSEAELERMKAEALEKAGFKPAGDEEQTDDSAEARQAELEAKFTETLNNVIFVGRWSMAKDGELGEPKEERYTISGARKIGGDRWLIFSRIEYGNKDITIPVPVRIAWAADAPVIVVDNFGAPGIGTYSARVVIHNGKYAGTWSGKGYGGLLSGVIRKADETEE